MQEGRVSWVAWAVGALTNSGLQDTISQDQVLGYL